MEDFCQTILAGVRGLTEMFRQSRLVGFFSPNFEKKFLRKYTFQTLRYKILKLKFDCNYNGYVIAYASGKIFFIVCKTYPSFIGSVLYLVLKISNVFILFQRVY